VGKAIAAAAAAACLISSLRERVESKGISG